MKKNGSISSFLLSCHSVSSLLKKGVCVCVSECRGKQHVPYGAAVTCRRANIIWFRFLCVLCVCTLQKHLVVRRAATSTQSLSLSPHTHKEAAARRGNSLVGKTKDHSQLDLVISNKDITDCTRVCLCLVCASAHLCFCMSHISNPTNDEND